MYTTAKLTDFGSMPQDKCQTQPTLLLRISWDIKTSKFFFFSSHYTYTVSVSLMFAMHLVINAFSMVNSKHTLRMEIAMRVELKYISLKLN